MPGVGTAPTVAGMRRLALVLGCVVAACGWLASSTLAVTRYAAPSGRIEASTCTDPAAPCTLSTALDSAQAEDTISLANGSYDLMAKALPAFPLHWLPTEPQTRPVISSNSALPTLSLTAAQSGTTFDHLQIDNTAKAVMQERPTALALGPGTDATIRSSVISGFSCIAAPDAGKVEIDDSTIDATAATTCLDLSADSALRRSSVQPPEAVIAPALPPPLVVTRGLVEDSSVTGGLSLSAPTSVARRVRAIGVIGISGQGLVVDSFAEGFGPKGAAIEATAPKGGALRVVGSTAIGKQAPALLAVTADVTDIETLNPNDLVVTDSIARSTTTDIEATPLTTCSIDGTCSDGVIHIDHSLFNARTPLATDLGAAVITEGPGNRTGDPLFVDPIRGDYHLLPGSPAIDAGVVDDSALPSDLDGHARAQGGPDLGAFETTALATGASGGRGGGSSGPHTRAATVLSRLSIAPARFHVDGRAKIRFSLDNAASVKLAFQRAVSGHRKGSRCVSGRGRGRGKRCRTWRGARHLTVPDAKAGANTVLFLGRVGGHPLPQGRYRLTATPAGGKARSVRLTVLP